MNTSERAEPSRSRVGGRLVVSHDIAGTSGRTISDITLMH